MELSNSSSYKKQTMASEFTHSCLGRIIIFAVITLLLVIIAMFTTPSDSMMRWQMEDNVRQCIQDHDSITSDKIDETFNNVCRIFTHADSTANDKELLKIFNAYNRLEYYDHSIFKTCRLVNNIHPEGLREGIGIFGIVIPFLNYDDFLMSEGPVRGKNIDRLIKDQTLPDSYLGDNPMLKPYHYKGNPDD